MSTLTVASLVGPAAQGGNIFMPSGRLISPGSVLQVVQSQLTTQPSAASTVFVDTGLSVAITPRAVSSKVLVFATGIMSSSNGSPNVGIGRDAILPNNSGLPYVSAQADYSWPANSWPFSLSVLDTPNTASQVVYKLMFRSAAGTVYLNRSGSVTTEFYASVSTIIAMEIAG